LQTLKTNGYDGQGLCKRRQEIFNLIVATLWVNPKSLDFDGIFENTTTMKTIFVRVKDMTELAYSLEETITVHEDGNQLPPHPTCGKLKKESDEKILKNQHAPSLRRSNK